MLAIGITSVPRHTRFCVSFDTGNPLTERTRGSRGRVATPRGDAVPSSPAATTVPTLGHREPAKPSRLHRSRASSCRAAIRPWWRGLLVLPLILRRPERRRELLQLHPHPAGTSRDRLDRLEGLDRHGLPVPEAGQPVVRRLERVLGLGERRTKDESDAPPAHGRCDQSDQRPDHPASPRSAGPGRCVYGRTAPSVVGHPLRDG